MHNPCPDSRPSSVSRPAALPTAGPPPSFGECNTTSRPDLPGRHRKSGRAPSAVRRLVASAVWTTGCIGASLMVPGVAEAATGLAAAESLQQVIGNLRNVIVGLLVGLATLFATIGGVRYILAGGDPSEVEAAKKGLRYAGIGYGVAILAPLLVKLLQQIVGA
ncbi:pilin [Spirillospora sp. NPDC127200]